MTFNGIDCELTNEVVCPYCGYEHLDSWEYAELEGSALGCGKCGKHFLATRIVDVSYSTTQCACLNGEAAHQWSEWEELWKVESKACYRRYCKECSQEERKNDA